MTFQAGPFAVDFAAFYFAAQDEHAVGVAVIGAAIAVFFGGAAEFAHGGYDVYNTSKSTVRFGALLPAPSTACNTRR
jgi:hypothetical protein